MRFDPDVVLTNDIEQSNLRDFVPCDEPDRESGGQNCQPVAIDDESGLLETRL